MPLGGAPLPWAGSEIRGYFFISPFSDPSKKVLFPKFFIFGALAEVIVEMDHYDTVVPMHKSQNVKNLREKDQNAKKKYARA